VAPFVFDTSLAAKRVKLLRIHHLPHYCAVSIEMMPLTLIAITYEQKIPLVVCTWHFVFFVTVEAHNRFLPHPFSDRSSFNVPARPAGTETRKVYRILVTRSSQSIRKKFHAPRIYLHPNLHRTDSFASPPQLFLHLLVSPLLLF
jgi:hypothetical protein